MSQIEDITEYRFRRKDEGIALILASLNLEYLYLDNPGLFLLKLFTGGGFGIWWFINLFRTKGMVESYNRKIALDILGA